MFEVLTLALFIVALFLCVGLGISMLYALVFGLIIFITYGIIKGYSIKNMLEMSFNGIKTIKNILFVFLLIGILTAVWRGAGTIPIIIYYATKLISPQLFVLASFLLCSLVSVLTGTSFGTAATMGVICMMMGEAMGASKLWLGGAILAGALFGDRCSPMSTSALLVSELTDTSIFDNIRNMIKTSVVPFVLTCVVYLLAGFLAPSGEASSRIVGLFANNFNLTWITVSPAVLIIVLSIFKINVKIIMSLSIITGAVVCLTVQEMGFVELIRTMIFGYRTNCVELEKMINGGGLISMLNASAIVCLSSCYSGIFEGTGLLDGAKKIVQTVSFKTTSFGSVAIASVFTGIISCNQTLAIMLTHQLCSDIYDNDKEKVAIALENTAVVIAPLVPWSIAGAVPLSTISAPISSIAFACYLYLIPIWNYAISLSCKKNLTMEGI